MIRILKKQAATLSAVILISAAILILSCSKSTEPDFVTPVSLSSVFEDEQLASNVSRVTLMVSSGNVLVLTEDLPFSDGAVQGVVQVPPGKGLIFTLNAYDSAGRLLYSGSAVADVSLGSDIEVNIQLTPQVLMLKVDPLFQVADPLLDTSYYFDVYVYNVQNLFGASFRIQYSPDVISATNVEIGAFLGAQPVSMVMMDTGYVAVGITRTQGQQGVSGFGHLARIYFYPLANGTTDLNFDLQTVSLADASGAPVIGFSSLVLEWGQVVVSFPMP